MASVVWSLGASVTDIEAAANDARYDGVSCDREAERDKRRFCKAPNSVNHRCDSQHVRSCGRIIVTRPEPVMPGFDRLGLGIRHDEPLGSRALAQLTDARALARAHLSTLRVRA